MQTGTRLQNLVLGFVFLGGVVLLGLATLLVRDVGFEEYARVAIRFQNVSHLTPGESVDVSGITIGEVEAIEYAPDSQGRGDVLVRCRIDKNVRLTDATMFRVRSLGPLGGRFLEIETPPGGTVRNADWDGFVGTASQDVFEQLGSLVEEARSGSGLVSRLIRDEQLARRVDTAFSEVASTFEALHRSLEEGKGLLPRLLTDETFALKVDSSVTEIQRLFADLNKEEGIVDDLEVSAQKLREIVDSVQSGQGVAGLLLADKEARDKVDRALSQLSVAAEKLSNQESLIGRLFSDPELAKSFEKIVNDIAEITDKASRGDGVFAKLLNDEEMWNEVKRLVVLARESIEDLREQAPINTFANVLFAVF
jgi:phospholipid/cholesterol/gamma-HCH transport system substrate-binding protein